MTTVCRSIALALLGVAASTGLARGAGRPLLVAVEAAPGGDVGPADVRQVVAAELAEPVVGAREANADAASDILLVALDPREIRMSLRAGAGPIVSRTIAAPPDRPGRLRSIGWLAGNLVRDQVGPIVAAREAPPPAAALAPSYGATGSAPRRAASIAAHPAAVVRGRPRAAAATIPHSAWAITVGGGRRCSSVRGADVPGDARARGGVLPHSELRFSIRRRPTACCWAWPWRPGRGSADALPGRGGIRRLRAGDRRGGFRGRPGLGVEALERACPDDQVTNEPSDGRGLGDQDLVRTGAGALPRAAGNRRRPVSRVRSGRADRRSPVVDRRVGSS